MKLLVNNQPFELTKSNTLVGLIDQFGVKGQFAVAHNGQFVAKHLYERTILNQSDKIEILSPIQGG